MTNSINKNEYYETTDFALATTLVYIGFDLEDVKKANPRKAIFVFRKTKKIEDTIQAFWNNDLQVNPLGFFNTQRSLKARLYET